MDDYHVQMKDIQAQIKDLRFFSPKTSSKNFFYKGSSWIDNMTEKIYGAARGKVEDFGWCISGINGKIVLPAEEIESGFEREAELPCGRRVQVVPGWVPGCPMFIDEHTSNEPFWDDISGVWSVVGPPERISRCRNYPLCIIVTTVDNEECIMCEVVDTFDWQMIKLEVRCEICFKNYENGYNNNGMVMCVQCAQRQHTRLNSMLYDYIYGSGGVNNYKYKKGGDIYLPKVKIRSDPMWKKYISTNSGGATFGSELRQRVHTRAIREDLMKKVWHPEGEMYKLYCEDETVIG